MPRRNVLFVHTDQQRWDALGANGNDEIRTPNLDELAAEGVSFDRCFVQNPVCMPSRASYMTGRYPSQLGIYRNGVTLPEDVPTMASPFGTHGYVSGALGKLHFLPHANRDHREPHPDYGFDHLEVSDEPGPYEDAYRAWVRDRAPDQVDAVSPGLPPAAEAWNEAMGVDDPVSHPEERFPERPVAFRADDGLTHSAFVADRTVDFLERHRDDRFLCVAGFYSPHSPWVVPRTFLDRYDRDALSVPSFPPEVEAEREEPYDDETLRGAKHGYYAMVSEVDHHVGRILSRLDELGLREETLVVFTSDHGEYLGEHLTFGKSFPGPDPVSRVPLLVRSPDVADPGRTESGTVEAVDLLPTLLDAVGLPVDPNLAGRSFRAALDGRGFEGRPSALLEHARGKTLRTDDYRYVARADGSEALHHLPDEFGAYRDVSDDPDHRAALADHRRRLLDRCIDVDLAGERERTWRY